MKAILEDVAFTVDLLTRLRVPGRKVPVPIRKLLPNPLGTLEDWERATHSDIADMPTATRAAEGFRLKVAVAQVESELVPEWVLDRLSRLEAAA